MPYIVLVWLLLPWLLDLWLTVVIAGAVGVNVWLFFLVSAVLGIALLVWEWRRVQTYWRALRRLEGSPWPLLASARRGLAAVLLIVPGLGSDVLALLLLCLGWRRGSARTGADNVNVDGRPRETAYRAPPDGAIEGEFRREE